MSWTRYRNSEHWETLSNTQQNSVLYYDWRLKSAHKNNYYTILAMYRHLGYNTHIDKIQYINRCRCWFSNDKSDYGHSVSGKENDSSSQPTNIKKNKTNGKNSESKQSKRSKRQMLLPCKHKTKSQSPLKITPKICSAKNLKSSALKKHTTQKS